MIDVLRLQKMNAYDHVRRDRTRSDWSSAKHKAPQCKMAESPFFNSTVRKARLLSERAWSWLALSDDRAETEVSTVLSSTTYYANEAETEPNFTHPQCLDPSWLGGAGRRILVLVIALWRLGTGWWCRRAAEDTTCD